MQTQRAGFYQEQRQKLSPQFLQSLQILSLPILDLEQRIATELEANPALEVIEEKAYESLDTTLDERFREDSYSDSYQPGAYDSYEYGTYAGDESDNRHQFMQSALTRPESLQEHLLWQLRLQPIPEDFFQIGELLVRNLDEHGFHREDPQTLVAEDRYGSLREVMKIIQGLEPVGTCVANYRESLLVQASLAPDHPPALEAIINSDYLMAEKNKSKEIIKSLKLDEGAFEEAIEFLRTLQPYPGLMYSSSSAQYVIPDVLVTTEDGEFVIIINDERIPVLGINPFFDAMLKQHDEAKKEARRFAQGKLRDARWFINSVKMRNETLIKVARAIVEYQKEFFLHGPRKIMPLTLRDIADSIGVHEATVSRMTNGKYMQTEWGLFEMKYFFSGSIAGTQGQQFSREGIKFILKEILEAAGDEQLSDQKLAEMLESRGVKIARRTVAKYRKELDIASSYER